MLIPLKHENMAARRWPIITIALIVINVLAFIATQTVMDSESPELGKVKAHILLVAARYPDVKWSPDAQQLIDTFRKKYNKEFERAKDLNSPVIDEYDAHLRMSEAPPWGMQDEADKLSRQYKELESASLTENYGFVPAHPTWISYLSANFLHGGWLHLIGNMWFLWLAGFVLEDVWGRPLYTIFYLIAGAAALQIHLWMNPASLVPCVGASGAVAGLMGAFLVRFPRMKITMGWLFGFRFYKFQAEAFWLLPFWLAGEVFSGAIFGEFSGVAHWAHVGGFIFGAAAAWAIRGSGLEHTVNKTIETKLSVSGNVDIDAGNDCLQHGQLEEAFQHAQMALAEMPDSIEAYTIQREVHWRRSETEQYLQLSEKICALYIKAKAPEAALHIYDDFIGAANGKNLQPGTWMSVIRGLEELENYDRALQEFEKLAAAYPGAQQSIMAQMGAARLCLKKLGRPQDALRFYQAADRSPVPHLDVESMIQIGIREAQKAMETPSGAALARA